MPGDKTESGDALRVVALPSGAAMPIVGFGTWQIQGQAAYDSVACALACGYRHIDTATVYGNEAQVGRALADSGIAREELFVTTKMPPGQGRGAEETLAASLRDLRIDYVDLWLIHWHPGRGRAVALYEAMLKAGSGGLARAVGVSNFDSADIDELIAATGVVPQANQVRLSPFEFDRALARDLRERGVVLEGYSPFQASRMDHPVLVDLARALGVSPAQVIVRWHVQHGIVVIPKSVHPERIAENLDVFSFSLDDASMARLDALS